MLTPEYYDVLTDDLIRLYSDLDNAIIADITRRILKTGRMTESAKWQAKQLQESGLLYDDILAEIAKRTDATENHIRALFEDASVESVKIDNQSYKKAGLSGIIMLSPAAMQVLNAGFAKCSGNLKNLTMTTAFTSQQAYITACNNAYMQVTSGAFDYNTAIRNAIKSAAVEGTHVLYPTGHKDRIDVAVRRAVLTGVGQTVRQLSVINANDMGCDIMEITAHSGARPSHAVWQGKLVSLSGKNAGKIIEGCRVLSLSEIGYGSGDGFGGWNCRHDWYPFFVGISKRAYSDERLKELDTKNIEYNGKKYSEYEISQIQRRYEREIRSAKREQVAFKTAVQKAQDPELKAVMQDSLNYANSVVKDKQAKMRDFINQTGQFRDYSREQNYGRINYLKNITQNDKKTLSEIYYTSERLSCQVFLKGNVYKKCIESIYNACIDGCFPEDTELSVLDSKSADIAGKIETVLKEENVSHDKTEELFDLISDMSVHKETRGFCYGFRLGSQLMTEIL
ncbi:MAG: phage minor capsid protein [Ruminococcus sp.]|nr:phage minor capsid protein [Ruminococcus sp.]